MKLATTKPPAKASSANSIDRLEHDALRPVESEARPDGHVLDVPRRHLDLATQAREQHGQHDAHQGIAHDDQPICVGRRGAPVDGDLGDDPRDERPDRGRERAHQLVSREHRRCAVVAGTSWLSDACSTARNGPTSLPLGLMTPMVAATASTAKMGVATNASPATSIRPAPAMSTRRRPMRSACVVSHSEMAASPSSVRVSSSPISRAGIVERREVQDQHGRQEAVAEHAQAARREQQRDVTVHG